MTTHIFWSCHVTLAANFENFYFLPNSVSHFRKGTKFGGNWLKNKMLQAKSKTRDGPPLPNAYMVKSRLKDQLRERPLNIGDGGLEGNAAKYPEKLVSSPQCDSQ